MYLVGYAVATARVAHTQREEQRSAQRVVHERNAEVAWRCVDKLVAISVTRALVECAERRVVHMRVVRGVRLSDPTEIVTCRPRAPTLVF